MVQQRRSQYADLAENYPADNQYEVGTVLIFGGDLEVTPTALRGDTRIAGVVTKISTLDEQCIARRQCNRCTTRKNSQQSDWYCTKR